MPSGAGPRATEATSGPTDRQELSDYPSSLGGLRKKACGRLVYLNLGRRHRRFERWRAAEIAEPMLRPGNAALAAGDSSSAVSRCEVGGRWRFEPSRCPTVASTAGSKPFRARKGPFSVPATYFVAALDSAGLASRKTNFSIEMVCSPMVAVWRMHDMVG